VVEAGAPAPPRRTAPLSDQPAVADAERQVIEAALARNRWNRAEACRELGISRSTLWRKMRRLGIAAE